MSEETQTQAKTPSCHEQKQAWSMHTICFALLGIGVVLFLAAKYFNWNLSGVTFLLPALLCVGSHVVMMKFMGHDHGSKK